MKKLLLLAPALCLAVGLMTTEEDATAGEPVNRAVLVNPAVLQFYTTTVHGTVDMTAAKNGQFAGMTCDKLSVSASSVEMKPCAPGGGFCFQSPKWVHTQSTLTPTANPAICSYNIAVPAGSAFGLNVGTQVNVCGGSGFTGVSVKPSPSTGQLSVPFGGSKQADLIVTSFNRECIN
jgi:hypothetical protein